MGSTLPRDWVVSPKYWRWAGTATARLAFLWLLCLGLAGYRLHTARHVFDTPDRGEIPAASDRSDGNSGHTHIDFGGQWVMGRMVAAGHARELYDRNRLRHVVQQGFPVSDEPPEIRDHVFPSHLQPWPPRTEVARHDSDSMMEWFMGRDSPRWQEVGEAIGVAFAADALVPVPVGTSAYAEASRVQLTPELVAAVNAKEVGGPLYPPIHGFVYAPLGMFRPADAYAILQVLSLAMTFVAGLGVWYLSRGKIAVPAATLVFLLFPGYRSGLDLGQNQVFTLAVAVWGWALAARGREGLGGMVWGLFAIKPVWGLAFVIVPLVMGRWKMCIAMAVTGCGLAAATLPFTGVEVWKDWLKVGAEASETYKVNKNWIGLSRDLHGIPRRILLDFTVPEAQRGKDPLPGRIGWGMWGFVLLVTAGVYLWRGKPENRTGLAVGFLFLGAYLCCYRFMYYDSLLAAVAILVLFANPTLAFRTWRFEMQPAMGNGDPCGPRVGGYVNSVSLAIVVLLLLCENWVYKIEPGFKFSTFEPQVTLEAHGYGTMTTDPFGRPVRQVPKLTAAVGYFYAWDTLLVLALWAWCGLRLAFAGDSPTISEEEAAALTDSGTVAVTSPASTPSPP